MADEGVKPEDIFVRPFSDWMREQAGGKSHEEMGEALYDLVQRVQDTGKKGTVSYTITVAPMKGDSNMLMITDKIVLKVPEHDRKPSLFYTDQIGNLTREDPAQPTFDSLREVPPPNVDPVTGEIKELNA